MTVQAKTPISENWEMFAQFQSDKYDYFQKIIRCYQQFRNGPAYKSFQFGMGVNLDQHGSNDYSKINFLLFVHNVID